MSRMLLIPEAFKKRKIAKTPAPTRNKITIDITWGGDPVEIEAQQINEFFCIHRSITKIEPESYTVVEVNMIRYNPSFSSKHWTVTHIPSGLAIGKFRTKKLALSCVEELMETNVKWEHTSTEKMHNASNALDWKDAVDIVARYKV